MTLSTTAKVTYLPLLLVTCLVSLPQLSEAIFTPALPNLSASLSISAHMAQWTLSIYFIGFSVGVTLWGQLSDRIGRRKTMLLGISIYAISNIFGSIADSIWGLFLVRFIQAFGISVAAIVTLTMLRDVYYGKKRHQLFSKITVILAMTPAIGVLVGGYVVHMFNWRINFVVLLLLGSLLFLYSFSDLPETYQNIPTKIKQPVSIIKLILKMCFDRRIIASAFLIGTYNGILYSFYAEAPFIVIKLLHYSANHYGYLGIPIALFTAFGAMVSHRLHEYLTLKRIVILGCVLTSICMLLLLMNVILGIITYRLHIWSIVFFLAPMLGFFMGFGLVVPNVLSRALIDYEATLGTAASLLSLSYYIWISMLLFIMGLIHNGTVFPMPVYFLILAVLSVFFTIWGID